MRDGLLSRGELNTRYLRLFETPITKFNRVMIIMISVKAAMNSQKPFKSLENISSGELWECPNSMLRLRMYTSQ